MPEDKTAQGDRKVGLEVELYEELSRLNNELSNMHRELAKKNTELKKLNEEKNRFLGMAAHDIRKPLSIISIYSEFLQNELSGVAKPEQFEFVQIIKEVGEQALSIVNDFLDFSKIEAGKLDLNLAACDLALITNEVVRLNRVLAVKKNVDISLDSLKKSIRTVLDEQKIRQVLDNIVGNAVKFSPPHSEVKVEIRQTNDSFVISVQDQGPGVPENEQARMFQPYEQLGAISTGGYSGSGLGLAIAQKIIAAHQGAIRVESETEKGATFFIEIPLDGSDLKGDMGNEKG